MIAAACIARAPPAPATQRRARSLRALVVARVQRAPVQAPSEPHAALQAVVRALETAAVVAAVGAHAAAAAATVRQQQAAAAAQQPQQQRGEQQNGQSVAHVAAAPATPQWLAVQPSAWATPSSLWLTLPLLAALVLGRIRAWLSGSSSPRRVSTEAAARLLRAEAAAGQQAQRIEELARQLDKLSVRSRVVGRDLKLPIQQLQAAAGQQAEALVSVAARMERLEKEIRDTEELVEAMQGVSAKQFALLLKVLEQQQAQQAQQAQEAQQAAAAEPPPQQQAQAQAQAQRPQKAAVGSTAASAQPSPAGAQQQGKAAAGAGQAAGGQIDEWGRTVRPVPSASRPPSPPQVGWVGVANAAPARATSTGGTPRPRGSVPKPRCSADAMAEAAAAAAAEGPLSCDQAQQAQQAQRAQQAQQAQQRQGLNQDSLLGIMGEDEFWKAEQQIISAVVNQPKLAPKPEVEILPPLFPPAPELTPEEAALQRERQQQVEEWRLRMRRSWDMSRLEAALDASHDEEADESSDEAARAVAEAPTTPAPSSEQAPGSSSAVADSSSAGAESSSAGAESSSAGAGSSSAGAHSSSDAGGSGHSQHGGAFWEDSGAGSTSFSFDSDDSDFD